MGRSSQLVTEDSDLEEGKSGRQTHHMEQHGQRHVDQLNDPNYMPCNLVITRLATAGGGTDALAQKINQRRTYGVEQPASAHMRHPVCHPQCGYNDWKRVEVVELMKMRQLLVLGFQEMKWKGDRVVDLGE